MGTHLRATGITCHMGSHSHTVLLATWQMNAPCLLTSTLEVFLIGMCYINLRFTYLPTPEGWRADLGSLIAAWLQSEPTTAWSHVWRPDHCATKPAMNCNSNRHDNVYGAVIMAHPLREFTRFIWWIHNSARWLPIFRRIQSAWAAGLPVCR